MSGMQPQDDEDLRRRHEAAEANPVTFSYAKPEGVGAGKGFITLGRKDIVRGVVQVVRSMAARTICTTTSRRRASDGAEGPRALHGPDDVLIGEFGPHEGTICAAVFALLVRERRRRGPGDPGCRRSPRAPSPAAAPMLRAAFQDRQCGTLRRDPRQGWLRLHDHAACVDCSCDCLVSCLAAVPARAQAEESAPFYRGIHSHRDLTGVPAAMRSTRASSPSIWGALIAGNPGFIAEHAGAGGLQAANYLSPGTAGRHHHRDRAFEARRSRRSGQQGRAPTPSSSTGSAVSTPIASSPERIADQDLGRHAQGEDGGFLRRGLADGDLSRHSQQAVRDQDQGDRGLQGWRGGLYRPGRELDGRCGELTVIKSTRRTGSSSARSRQPILISEAQSGISRRPDQRWSSSGRADPPAARSGHAHPRPDRASVMLPPGVRPAGAELRAAPDATMADRAFRADIERRACMSIRSAGRRWLRPSSALLLCRRKSLPAHVK